MLRPPEIRFAARDDPFERIAQRSILTVAQLLNSALRLYEAAILNLLTSHEQYLQVAC